MIEIRRKEVKAYKHVLEQTPTKLRSGGDQMFAIFYDRRRKPENRLMLKAIVGSRASARTLIATFPCSPSRYRVIKVRLNASGIKLMEDLDASVDDDDDDLEF